MKSATRHLNRRERVPFTPCAIILLLALAPVCLAQLSGPLSGTLGPGEYDIVDTIYVNADDSLRLLPGTIFNFDGPYPFEISGTLLAEGVEGDSIIFTTDTLVNPDRWRGLRFLVSTSSGSQLEYCLIQYASYLSCGGGIYFNSSSPTFSNCIISGNSTDDTGGGIACTGYSSPRFIQCTINGNSSYYRGGGIACIAYSSPRFIQCTISGNSNGGIHCRYSSPNFTECTIIDNTIGGGVNCSTSAMPTFTHCTISGNSASSGGGVYCSSSAIFMNCVISGNSASYRGGGVYCGGNARPIFNNCTFSFNYTSRWGGGVYSRNSTQTFTNCVFYRNSALGHGGGVSVEYLSEVRIENSILWENSPEQIYRSPDAERLTVYYCDVQGGGSSGINMDVDPLFRNPEEDDFHLMWTECGDSLDSPCIDRGNPYIQDDSLDCNFGLGTSRSDMGVYGGNAVPTGVSNFDNLVVPKKFTLFQNYPNPFNATTTIRYDVKQASQVQLTIFNLLGQKVTTLTDSKHLPGSYTLSWNAAGLPSGIYLCRMETGEFYQTRKLVLLK